jgi:hypothetical protein
MNPFHRPSQGLRPFWDVPPVTKKRPFQVLSTRRGMVTAAGHGMISGSTASHSSRTHGHLTQVSDTVPCVMYNIHIVLFQGGGAGVLFQGEAHVCLQAAQAGV